MREHGVLGFPDPVVTSTPPTRRSTPPAEGGGTAGYSQMYGDGILFKIPSSIENSPRFQSAAKVCNLTSSLTG